MAAPILLVEFGFNKSGTDYVWNDISAYVRNVNINRGTSREIEAYSAGSATVVLSNKDRRFDPTNTSSPYYSAGVTQIQPAGAIRITSGGLVQFYGFIDNWTFEYPNQGYDGVATVMAYDGLSNLAKAIFADTYNTEQYTGNRIQQVLNRTEVYWNSALTDIDGGYSTVYGDTILSTENVNVLNYLQQVAKSEPGDLFIARDGKATFRDRRYLTDSWNSATTRYNYCLVPNFESGTTFYWSTITQSSVQKYNGTYSGLPDFNSNGAILRRITTYAEGDASKYTANVNYMVSLYVYQVGGGTIYLQSSLMNGLTNVASVSSSTVVASNTWTRISTPVLSTISAVDGIEIYLENDFGNSNNLFIDAVLIEPSNSLNDYFDGTYTPTNDGSKRYTSRWLALANKSASTLETSTLKTNPTVATTINFSDYSGSDIPYTGIKVSYNSENLYNRVAISKTSAPVTVLKEDTAAQDIYGVRTYGSTDYLNKTDTELENIAAELLSVYVKPELRVEQMELQLHGLSPANQTTVLGIDMRQLVQITFRPSRTGSQMVKKYVVIGISQNIDKAKTHSITFTVASIDNLPFHLNSSMLGVLNTNVLSY